MFMPAGQEYSQLPARMWARFSYPRGWRDVLSVVEHRVCGGNRGAIEPRTLLAINPFVVPTVENFAIQLSATS
jgi:hypothetical protein